MASKPQDALAIRLLTIAMSLSFMISWASFAISHLQIYVDDLRGSRRRFSKSRWWVLWLVVQFLLSCVIPVLFPLVVAVLAGWVALLAMLGSPAG